MTYEGALTEVSPDGWITLYMLFADRTGTTLRVKNPHWNISDGIGARVRGAWESVESKARGPWYSEWRPHPIIYDDERKDLEAAIADVLRVAE